MEKIIYNSLQLTELFHLEFLRWFSRKVKSQSYALKGGANLRFFFKSCRYSEDMDLDIQGIEVNSLKETVMKILQSLPFQEAFNPFGIERIVPPDIIRAKQTRTTQRFKVHLITFAGEDLFTKIEFSRRGFGGRFVVQPVSNSILRAYKLPPLFVSHYDIECQIMQKIEALAGRALVQARDIFDLYVLNSQYQPDKVKRIKINGAKLTKAYNTIFEISFEQFRDTVIAYLSEEDKMIYNAALLWDEIKLKTADFIKELQ